LLMEMFGTAAFAFLGMVLWDCLRMFIQNWFLKRSLKEDLKNSPLTPTECSRCQSCNNGNYSRLSGPKENPQEDVR